MAAVNVWSSASAVAHWVNGSFTGQDHAAPFVALGDDVEEQIRLVASERQVTDLVNDQQPGSEVPA